MDLSIFLARLLGIYLLIVAAELLLRRRELEGAVKDFASSKGLLVFSGSLSLLFGLMIVIAHPVFEASWHGLITLIGCLLVLRGIIRVAFPTHIQKKASAFFRQRYWVIFFVLLIVGLYLTYTGFTTHVIQG